MTIDTALNLLWLGIGLSALILLAISEYRHGRRSRWQRGFRLTAVLLVTVSLFPCVSASDDLFSFAFLQSHLGRGGYGTTPPEDGREKSSTVHLARLLQSLEHLQVSAFFSLAFALIFLAPVYAAGRVLQGRGRVCRAGRAPPFLLFS